MGLRTESQLVIICDVCGEMETNAGQGREYSIKSFRLDGWSIGKIVKCPKCRKSKTVKRIEKVTAPMRLK